MRGKRSRRVATAIGLPASVLTAVALLTAAGAVASGAFFKIEMPREINNGQSLDVTLHGTTQLGFSKLYVYEKAFPCKATYKEARNGSGNVHVFSGLSDKEPFTKRFTIPAGHYYEGPNYICGYLVNPFNDDTAYHARATFVVRR